MSEESAEKQTTFDLEAVYRKYKAGGIAALSDSELQLASHAEMMGGIGSELPFHLARKREAALDRPSQLAILLDPFYEKFFEHRHYQLLDEIVAPYLLNETITIDGSNHNPSDYIGLMVRMSRDTFKSTIMGLALYWKYLHFKIRRGIDLREMYTHQVIAKAVERGEIIRNYSRDVKHQMWRLFPEFRGQHGEWDQKIMWRWPNFSSTGAAEWSFVAYGESSDKTGGHYTGRWVDDWETEDSVTNPTQRQLSYQRYRMMDNLKDRSQSFNPMIHSGTTYHFDGVLKRIERDGGYLVWDVPAFRGSPKTLFDLCSIDVTNDAGRRKVKLGIKKLTAERASDLHFPKRLDWNELYLSAKAQGSHVFNCQMCLNPTPEDEQRFDGEIIRTSFVEDCPQPFSGVAAYIRCDPAIGVKKDNDETAIIVGLVDWRGWRIVVDGWAGREKRPTEIVRKLFAFAHRWMKLGYTVQNIGIEAVQYQEALAQLCRDGVPEREAEYSGELIPVMKSPVPIRSIQRSADMRKTERLLQMDGPISRREVQILKSCPVAQKLETQLVNFPHDKDDLLDALRDLWTGVMVPARPLQGVEPRIHAEITKLLNLRKKGQKPTLRHTHNVVQLENWS